MWQWAAVRRHPAAGGNSLRPEWLQGSLLPQRRFTVAGSQWLTLPAELHTCFCTPKTKGRSLTLLATGVSLWLCSGLTYTLCQVFFFVCCTMASKPSCSLLNSLHCPEGRRKPSHSGHWMCFESRSNKRSYKEGKSKFTGFQWNKKHQYEYKSTLGLTAQHCELWSCVYSFEFKQEGRDFCGSGTGSDGLPFPSFQLLETGTDFCQQCPLPLLLAGAAHMPSPVTPLPALAALSGSPHSALVVTQGCFSADACTVICALTSCEHLKLTVECRENGLFWVPQVTGMCIFPNKYLKNFGPQADNY